MKKSKLKKIVLTLFLLLFLENIKAATCNCVYTGQGTGSIINSEKDVKITLKFNFDNKTVTKHKIAVTIAINPNTKSASGIGKFKYTKPMHKASILVAIAWTKMVTGLIFFFVSVSGSSQPSLLTFLKSFIQSINDFKASKVNNANAIQGIYGSI